MNIGMNTIRETKRSRAVAVMALIVLIALSAVIGMTYYFIKVKPLQQKSKSALSQVALDQLCEDVSESVLENLEGSLLTTVVEKRLDEKLTEKAISEMFEAYMKDKDTELTAEQKELITKQVKTSVAGIGLTGDAVFTDKQKDTIQSLVNDAVSDVISETYYYDNGDVDIDTDLLKQEIEDDLEDVVKETVNSNTYQLTQSDINKIKTSLDLDSIVTAAIGKSDVVTSDALADIKGQIVTTVTETVKAPVKGVDYFTSAEIDSIVSSAASKASQDTTLQLATIQAQLTTNSSDVSNLKSQVSSYSSDISSLKASMGAFSTILGSGGSDGLATILATIDGATTLGQGLANLKNGNDVSLEKISVLEALFGDKDALNAVYDVASDPANESTVFAMLGSIISKVKTIQTDVGTNTSKIEANIASLQTMNASLTQAQQDLTANAQALEDAKAALADAIESGDQDAIAAAEADLQEKVTALQASIDSVADSDLNATEKATAKAMADAVQEALNNYKTGNDADVQNLYDAIDNANDSITGSNGLIAANTAAIASNTSSISELNDTLGTIDDTNENTVFGKIRALFERLTGLSADVGTNTEKISQNISSLQATNASLTQTQTDLAANVQALEDAKTTLAAAIESGDQDAIAAAEADLQEKVTALQESIDNVADSDLNATEKATAKAMADAVQEALDNYKTGNDADVQNLYDAIDDANDSITGANGLISANAAAIASNESAISGLNTQLGDIGDNSGTVWGNISDINNRVSSMIYTLDNPTLQVAAEDAAITDGDDETDHYVVITSEMVTGKDNTEWLNVAGSSLTKEILSSVDIMYAADNTVKIVRYMADSKNLYIFFHGDIAPVISRVTVIP